MYVWLACMTGIVGLTYVAIASLNDETAIFVLNSDNQFVLNQVCIIAIVSGKSIYHGPSYTRHCPLPRVRMQWHHTSWRARPTLPSVPWVPGLHSRFAGNKVKHPRITNALMYFSSQGQSEIWQYDVSSSQFVLFQNIPYVSYLCHLFQLKCVCIRTSLNEKFAFTQINNDYYLAAVRVDHIQFYARIIEI